MSREGRRPYSSSRYKNSMSPQPKNPFQSRRRTLSGGKPKTLVLPRYTCPPATASNAVADSFKQACIILVAGAILVSLLSVAVPPAPIPTNTHMTAGPRRPPQQQPPGLATANSGAAGASLNSNRMPGGGVLRSQSRVRKSLKQKRPQDNRPSEQQRQRQHQKYDHNQNEAAVENETPPSSEEQSPNRQKLGDEVEARTKENNDAANGGVFGRVKQVETDNGLTTNVRVKKKKNNKLNANSQLKKKKTINSYKVNDAKIHQSIGDDVLVLVTKKDKKQSDASAIISESNDVEVATHSHSRANAKDKDIGGVVGSSSDEKIDEDASQGDDDDEGDDGTKEPAGSVADDVLSDTKEKITKPDKYNLSAAASVMDERVANALGGDESSKSKTVVGSDSGDSKLEEEKNEGGADNVNDDTASEKIDDSIKEEETVPNEESSKTFELEKVLGQQQQQQRIARDDNIDTAREAAAS